MEGARAYLARRADEDGGRLAVNLDIDNTALATHYDAGEATPPVLRFALRAHRLDMAVLFNTARRKGDGNLRETTKVLRQAGYPVTRICGRHRATRSPTASSGAVGSSGSVATRSWPTWGTGGPTSPGAGTSGPTDCRATADG
jgi:hypothetical protein